jgi:hypothetical protein
MTQAMLALVENAEPSNWTTDPAQLNFTDYRDRQLWGPPDQAGKRQCINSALFRKPFSYAVEQRTNPYTNGEDANFGTWEQALDIGRSYLVGSSVPMGEFLRVHTSSLNEWQRMAYDWCLANPSRLLVLTSTTSPLIYHICKRGEYVEIGLPHHSHGGEKYWVSRTGKTKVLINVD